MFSQHGASKTVHFTYNLLATKLQRVLHTRAGDSRQHINGEGQAEDSKVLGFENYRKVRIESLLDSSRFKIRCICFSPNFHTVQKATKAGN